MHLIILIIVLIFAWLLRYNWYQSSGDWSSRWQRSLSLFLLPPLLLLNSAIAIVLMGPDGQMFSVKESWLSYAIAKGFLIIIFLYLIKLFAEGIKITNKLHQYPIMEINNKKVRVLNVPHLYIAQVGFWYPELIVTKGLLDTLSNEHLQAVLAHEEAHNHYHDTFYFFWLNWLKKITIFLPQTETIWQELLILREIRADRWAADKIDPLLVAESLLLVVQNSPVYDEFLNAACVSTLYRLNQRIDELLTSDKPIDRINILNWAWLLLSFSPLLFIPFHH